MYAVYREALALVEAGDTTLEDVDKAFRYDAGSWMTTMGVFRRMDYTGLQDYPEIFRNVFQKLSNRDELPALMQHLVAVKARGIQSESGFYTYAEGEGKEWEQAFSAFNKEIFELAANYSSVTVHHNKSTIADVSI
jgi:3-hydroxybutyryl-CoA dehydrogenase